jgi:prolyl-tRNA synthetase
VVGSKGLAEGKVELKIRKGGEVLLLPVDEAIQTVSRIVAEAL